MNNILIFSNHPAYTFNLRKEVIDGFVKKGYNVTVAVPYGPEIEYFESLGVKAVDLTLKGRSTNPFGDLKLLRDCVNIIRTEEPDVVLTYTTKLNIYGGIAAQITKTPYIPMITGLGGAIENEGILQFITSNLYRSGVRKAVTIFIQNETILKKMKKNNMIHSPIRLTPGSGVSLERHSYADYPKESEQIRFVFIGRIMQDKGIYELIEASKYIKEKYPNILFDVIGQAELEEDLNRVKEAESQGLINYLGGQNDVRPFIRRAHATILPSYYEGMANVLLESAAAGRPVLTTTVPGCKETFDEGVSGIGFTAKDVKSLIEAIEKFISLSYEEKKEMGDAGRRKMETQFDRRIILNMYLEEFDKIEKR